MGAVDRPSHDRCGTPIDENSPERPSSQYGKAKRESERLIEGSGLPFTTLRLPWCYGPGMSATTHVRKLTEMVMHGSVMTRFDWPGRVSVLDARECARAFAFVAIRADTLGRVLFVSDPTPLSLGELFREAGRTVGRSAGSIPVPRVVCWAARRLRRVLPLAVRSLFIDVLWVSDARIRELTFTAASRGQHYLLPLVRFVSQVKTPGRRHSRVVLTGAASGIGYALAVQLAASGRQVVMVDRDPDVVNLAERLAVDACVADLCEPKDLQRVMSLLGAADVNWIINGAGLGVRGDVLAVSDNRTAEVLGVNVDALTKLSVAAVRSFSVAGEGVVANIASSAALQPLPGMAVYAATKAYTLSFSEALGAEQADGISVITVCPAGVATGFQARAGVRHGPEERLMSPERVASAILGAAERHKTATVFIGAKTLQMSLLARIMPRWANVRLWKALMASHR
jgi:short-subunit dehydrogenase